MRGPAGAEKLTRDPAAALKPTVILDARMVGPKPVGIGTYVSLLVQGLAGIRERSGALGYRVVLLVADEGPGRSTDRWHGFETRTVRAPFLHLREQVELPRAIAEIAASTPAGRRTVYHSPSFSSLLRCPVPRLVTVHDLIHLHYGNPAQKLYYRGLVRPFLRGAAARMTVSLHSRNEIARWADVPSATIEVVNGAVDPELAIPASPGDVDPVLRSRELEPGRYLFCLSSPKRHKNVDTLIDAYRSYCRSAPAGSGSPLPLVVNVPGYKEVPGVRSVGTLSAMELKVLLASAAGFFFPSRDEGFGFPPLEAAVAGAPVALSDIPPLHEAMESFEGSELTWVAPMDRAGWAEAMRRAAAGGLPRPAPASRRRAVERFSPLRLAETMDPIYRRVLGIGSDS